MSMFDAEALQRAEVREVVHRPVATLVLGVDVSSSVDEEDDRDADTHRAIVVRHVTKQQVVDLCSGGRVNLIN